METSTLDALKDLGLKEPEANAYLALLKIGGATASTVAKEMGIKRTTAYPLLRALGQKGFVATYYRNSKQLYYAEKPNRLATYFERKLKNLNAIIPTLSSFEKKQATTVGLRFIETKEELEKFYSLALKEPGNKECHVIGDAPSWENIDPAFFTEYRKIRGEAKIKTKLLLTHASKQDNPENPALLREVRFLPKDYTFKSTIDIYRDKVLIVSPALSSLAVVIEIKAMVDVFESIFDILWDNVAEKIKEEKGMGNARR